MEYWENTLKHLENNMIQYLVTLVLIVAFLITRSLVMRLVKRHAQKYLINKSRELYIRKLISVAVVLVFATVIGMVWELSLKGLSIYFASIFTVVGVGLFASWSILSNLTASVILFFFFPHKIGEKVKIIDGENSVEGKIVDISLFYMKIETAEKEIYSYPNNLAIQKPIRQSQG